MTDGTAAGAGSLCGIGRQTNILKEILKFVHLVLSIGKLFLQQGSLVVRSHGEQERYEADTCRKAHDKDLLKDVNQEEKRAF